MEQLRRAAPGVVWLVVVLTVSGLGALMALMVTGGLQRVGSVETSSLPPTTRSVESLLVKRPRVPPPPVLRGFQIVATRGNCWLIIRDRTASGAVRFEGVLEQGQAVRLRGRSIWLSAGAAGNLDIRVDGKPVPLSGTIETVLPAAAHYRSTAG
jgi:RodZ C-terminal domain